MPRIIAGPSLHPLQTGANQTTAARAATIRIRRPRWPTSAATVAATSDRPVTVAASGARPAYEVKCAGPNESISAASPYAIPATATVVQYRFARRPDSDGTPELSHH